MDGEVVVACYRPPRVALWGFSAFSLVAPGAWVWWMVADASLVPFLTGGLMLLALIALWCTAVGERRLRRGGVEELRVTDTGLSTAAWSLDWNRVARVWIGRAEHGIRVRAIFIEPVDPRDIRWADSRLAAIGRRIGSVLPGSGSMPPLFFPVAGLDRSPELVLAELEASAGRPLGS